MRKDLFEAIERREHRLELCRTHANPNRLMREFMRRLEGEILALKVHSMMD